MFSTVDLNLQRVPNYEQETVVEIMKLFGEEPMRDFLRANLEQLTFTASASYGVEIVWSLRFNRKATLAEVIHFAKACCEVLIHQRDQVGVGLPTQLAHKRTRVKHIMDT